MSSNTVSNQLSSITAELQQIAYDSGFDDLTDTGALSAKCFSILTKNPMLTDVKIVNTDGKCFYAETLDYSENESFKKPWKPKNSTGRALCRKGSEARSDGRCDTYVRQ